MERVLLNTSERLAGEIAFGNLRQKFDHQIDHLYRADVSGAVVPIEGERFTRRQIHDAMVSEGYRKITNPEDIRALSLLYHIPACRLTDKKRAGKIFYVPVFPEPGEDNLVVVDRNSEKGFIWVDEYSSVCPHCKPSWKND